MEPSYEKNTEKLENVQRAATRWVPSLRDLSYEERLKKLQLPTLTERSGRGWAWRANGEGILTKFGMDVSHTSRKVTSYEYVAWWGWRGRGWAWWATAGGI